MTEDEKVGCHHQLNGHELAAGDVLQEMVMPGQGSLAYCTPWGHKESNRIE